MQRFSSSRFGILRLQVNCTCCTVRLSISEPPNLNLTPVPRNHCAGPSRFGDGDRGTQRERERERERHTDRGGEREREMERAGAETKSSLRKWYVQVTDVARGSQTVTNKGLSNSVCTCVRVYVCVCVYVYVYIYIYGSSIHTCMHACIL